MSSSRRRTCGRNHAWNAADGSRQQARPTAWNSWPGPNEESVSLRSDANAVARTRFERRAAVVPTRRGGPLIAQRFQAFGGGFIEADHHRHCIDVTFQRYRFDGANVPTPTWKCDTKRASLRCRSIAA